MIVPIDSYKPMLEKCDFSAINGSLKYDASLANASWFKVGGPADLLFKPKDTPDLIAFLKIIKNHNIPITILGASSNIIIRDGGIAGVVIKLGRGFTDINHDTDILTAGAFALDVNIARYCADAGLRGFSFLSGIPGTVGGGLKMNAGAYGGEFKDILETAHGVTYDGEMVSFTPDELNMRYRHTDTPDNVIFTHAKFHIHGTDSTENLKTEIKNIREKREASQPITERTSGSTFANPTQAECDTINLPKMKSWELIKGSGADTLKIGGASMSSLHRNFMINDGTATAKDLEDLGEAIRNKVFNHYGLRLRWEIKRIGRFLSQ